MMFHYFTKSFVRCFISKGLPNVAFIYVSCSVYMEECMRLAVVKLYLELCHWRVRVDDL